MVDSFAILSVGDILAIGLAGWSLGINGVMDLTKSDGTVIVRGV